MRLQLPARKPFNFLSVVNSHGWLQLAPFRFDEASSTLFYTDHLKSNRVVEYRISGSRDGLQVETDKLTKPEQE